MAEPSAHEKFLKQLRDVIAEHRGTATTYTNIATDTRKRLEQQQRVADDATAEADRWQKLLDFAVLSDSNNDLAHAFANAVLDRDTAATDAELLDRNAEGTAVMDGDEYYASMAAETIDPFDAYTDAQLDGTACINCGNEFGPDEASPAVMGPRGQMFEHIYPSGCGVAK